MSCLTECAAHLSFFLMIVIKNSWNYLGIRDWCGEKKSANWNRKLWVYDRYSESLYDSLWAAYLWDPLRQNLWTILACFVGRLTLGASQAILQPRVATPYSFVDSIAFHSYFGLSYDLNNNYLKTVKRESSGSYTHSISSHSWLMGKSTSAPVVSISMEVKSKGVLYPRRTKEI